MPAIWLADTVSLPEIAVRLQEYVVLLQEIGVRVQEIADFLQEFGHFRQVPAAGLKENQLIFKGLRKNTPKWLLWQPADCGK